MSPLDHLSGEFDKILKLAVRPDLAAFLAKGLSDDPNSHLPGKLQQNRKELKKPNRIDSWERLDLGELLWVLNDKYEVLKVGDKSHEARENIRLMRDVRNRVAHFTGAVDLHDLYNDARLLERFAVFIQARQVTVEVITNLRDQLRHELERVAGLRPQPVAPPPQASPPSYFQPSGNPFEKFEKLLAIHDEFVGRSKIIKRIRDFVSDRESGTLILEAEPGTGKSALIAHCIRHEFADVTSRSAYYLYHCGEGLTDPTDCLRTLYDQLVKTHEIEEAEALDAIENARDLSARFHRLLTKHVAPRLGENKQLIFIDSLDEAKTDTELTAYQALPDQLPQGIFVIASTRSIPERIKVLTRREHVQRLNLNLPDFDPDNLQDAGDFVRSRLKDKSIDSSTQDEICRLGAGNFLVLREICRWAREKLLPEDRSGFLKRLAAEPDGPLRAIYEEFWGRIPKSNLDAASSVAGLILEAQGPANDALALESGVVGRSGWETGIEHLAEYLKEIKADDGRASYRVYHQSFIDFLRTRVDWESQQARHALAKMCLRWRDLNGELREYAVKFGPEHLWRAAKWPDLENLLTNLKFVEEKCQLGMASKLVEDYRLASRYHPDWRKALEDEVEREESLRGWAERVMEDGRCWRDDLDKKWTSNDADLIELPKPYPFTNPPDTSQLRARLLKRLGADQHRQIESVATFRLFRSFVNHLAALLAKYPNAALPCAFNYNSFGTLAEQAEQLLTARDAPSWFEEHPRPCFDPRAIPFPTLRVEATAFAVSANGKWCVTGEKNGKLRFWDLETGEEVDYNSLAHNGEVIKILLSVDGSRGISFGSDGSIARHELQNGRWQARQLEIGLPPGTAAACSPEVSVIAVACEDNAVRVFDALNGVILFELRHEGLQEITSVHLIPERFIVIAQDIEGSRAIWDLVTGNRMRFIPSREMNAQEEDRGVRKKEEESEAIENARKRRSFSQFWEAPVSADGRIRIHLDEYGIEIDVHVDGNFCAELYNTADRDPVSESDLQLVGDGHILWLKLDTMICGLDVSSPRPMQETIEPRQFWRNPTGATYDFLLDSVFSKYYVDDYQPTNDTFSLHSHVVTRDESTPTDSSSNRNSSSDEFGVMVSPSPGNSSLDEGPPALTPDGQIAIDLDVEGGVALSGGGVISYDSIGPLLHALLVQSFSSETGKIRIDVSPDGQIAFVSARGMRNTACGFLWNICGFLWNIRSGRTVTPSGLNCASVHEVMPDWRSVVTIDDGKLNLCEIHLLEPTMALADARKASVSRDGRKLLVRSDDCISVLRIGQSQLSEIVRCPGARHALMSPDAKFVVCRCDDKIVVFDLTDGTQLIEQPHLYDPYNDRGTRID
jgi:WD40 repeat protein